MAGCYSKLLKSDLDSTTRTMRRIHRVMLFDLPDFDPNSPSPNIIDEFKAELQNKFFKFSKYNITISILSIRGYDRNDDNKAIKREGALHNLVLDIKNNDSISDDKLIINPVRTAVIGRPLCQDSFCYYGRQYDEYLYRSAEIVYMIIVYPPLDLPQCVSKSWQINLDENVGLTQKFKKLKQGIVFETGLGTITQLSPENCNSTDNIDRDFLYFTLGLGGGLKPPKIDLGETFKTLIQKIFSSLGITFQSTSAFSNLPNGQFMTSRPHSLQDFSSIPLVNLTFKLSASAVVGASASGSLIAMVIPCHDDSGLNYELVISIIIGNLASEINIDTEIGVDAGLSLTAGVVYFA